MLQLVIRATFDLCASETFSVTPRNARFCCTTAILIIYRPSSLCLQLLLSPYKRSSVGTSIPDINIQLMCKDAINLPDLLHISHFMQHVSGTTYEPGNKCKAWPYQQKHKMYSQYLNAHLLCSQITMIFT